MSLCPHLIRLHARLSCVRSCNSSWMMDAAAVACGVCVASDRSLSVAGRPRGRRQARFWLHDLELGSAWSPGVVRPGKNAVRKLASIGVGERRQRFKPGLPSRRGQRNACDAEPVSVYRRVLNESQRQAPLAAVEDAESDDNSLIGDYEPPRSPPEREKPERQNLVGRNAPTRPAHRLQDGLVIPKTDRNRALV